MARGRRPPSGKTRGSKLPSRTKPSSAKRLKTANATNAGIKTPFVSGITGQDYFFNEDNEETHVFIRYNAIKSDVEVPPSVTNFLANAVKPFARELHDILISPLCLITIITLDENMVDLYYKFCKPGKHRIPNSDCFLHASPCDIREVLREIYGGGYISNDSDSDIADSFEDFSSDSSAEEFNPIPPGKRGQPPASRNQSFFTEPPIPPAEKDASSSAAATDPAVLAVAVLEKPLSRRPALSPIADQTQISDAMEIAQPAMEPAVPSSTLVPPPETIPSLPMDSSHDAPSASKKAAQEQQLALRRRARARFSNIDFNKLHVSVPKENFLTILFRPTNPDDSFHKENPYKLTAALIKIGGHPIHTRNIREGGLAADFDPATPAAPLLQAKLLLDKPVSASLPKAADSCCAVVSGVHWEISDQQIIDDLKTEPPLKVLAVKRLAKPGQQSWTIKISFEGTALPTRAFLEGRSYRVRPYESKPLQCFKCGRYSHTARVCRSQINCWTCSGDHEATVCPNKASPKCGNCQGPHPVDDLTCPTRNFQVKVVQVKAAENVSFKVARQAVSKAAKTYASAVKTSVPAQPRKQKQPPATGPNYIPNIAHPRPPQQQAVLSIIFNGLIAILTAAAATKDFAGALTEVLRLFQTNSADPDQFQLPN